MFTRESCRYGKNIQIIHPGEYYISNEDELIGTLLGSCVAVCLYDPEKKISCMNHYMLPGRVKESNIFQDKSAKFGITAIKKLFNEMENAGCKKRNIIAKIFGGGHVLNTNNVNNTLPQDNIRVALIMMELEDIPVEDKDVGDNFTRKLMMDVKTGKIFLKKTTREQAFDNTD